MLTEGEKRDIDRIAADIIVFEQRAQMTASCMAQVRVLREREHLLRRSANKPCPCGSGKKVKHCHLPKTRARLRKLRKGK
jgi:uncharacterized protein YecA (UPF0149 family)